MEFFERAHVTRKEPRKKESKSEEAVKKQLKQMLHAYKKGNNQEIRSFGEKEINYDTEDFNKSVSEFSDFSFHKYAETSQEMESSHSEETRSNIELTSSSNSNSSKFENIGDSLESISEELKSPSSSRDISTTERDLSSTFDSSIISEYSDSDISIPSSLQTSDSNITGDEDFDPDGALASKILEKLSMKQISSKKRNLLIEELQKPEPKKEKKREFPKVDNLQKPEIKLKKGKKKVHTKKARQAEEDLRHSEVETYEIETDTDSCPFISVSAVDMQNQSLEEILGEYIHPTVKNLPSQKQHTVSTPLNKYTILDEMISCEVAEDISSIVPEIGEELEELTLDSELPDIENIFDSPIKLYNGRNNYIFLLKHPAEIYIHGKVKATAVGGSLEVFGYTLEDESIDIYAPYSYYAHCIKTNGKETEFHGLFSKLINAGLSTNEAEEIISVVTKNDAIFSLSNLNDVKMDFVDVNFSTNELFSRRNDQTSEYLKKAADNLGCSLYLDQPKKVFEEESIWDEVVSCGMSNSSRGIVCGGKGVGKSTFLRYYINRLLTNGPVLVVDLDPGQAEFTVPGNISVSVVDRPLVGPNFTHLAKPDRMLNIGMISTMDNPHRYISAINQLLKYCKNKQEYTHLPWIVNTMGMTNDIGLKFLTYTILELRPTFLYQIDSEVPKKKFPFELKSHMIMYMYQQNENDRLLASAKDPSNLEYVFIKSNEMSKGFGSGMSPKDERYLNVLAYFSQLVEIHQGKGILEIVPYEVSIRDLNIGVNVNIHHRYVTKVLNGKIIALCQLLTTDKGKVFNLRDDALLCHGYGLIRSIDFRQGLLYILTPVPIGTLSLVNSLVYADWMPELHGLEKELPNGTVIPYRLSTAENPTVMSRPRRRFNPLQLLKATRNA